MRPVEGQEIWSDGRVDISHEERNKGGVNVIVFLLMCYLGSRYFDIINSNWKK